MVETLVVPGRFRGPPTSGNGGWVCGAAAALVGGQAEVTLRRPPPLDRPLTVVRDGADLRIVDEHDDQHDVVVAARSTTVVASVPEPVLPAEAELATNAWPGHRRHPFASCFTCGPAREPGDGLRLFTGPVPGRPGTVAARWRPHPSTGAGDGLVDDRVVWAALDCPSGWPHLGAGDVTALLGRMAARVLEPVLVGEDYVVVGEGTAVDGRKRHSVSALFDADGACVAVARATWIVLDT